VYLKTTTDQRSVLEQAIAAILDSTPASRFFVRRHGNSWTIIGHALTDSEADSIIPQPEDVP